MFADMLTSGPGLPVWTAGRFVGCCALCSIRQGLARIAGHLTLGKLLCRTVVKDCLVAADIQSCSLECCQAPQFESISMLLKVLHCRTLSLKALHCRALSRFTSSGVLSCSTRRGPGSSFPPPLHPRQGPVGMEVESGSAPSQNGGESATMDVEPMVSAAAHAGPGD